MSKDSAADESPAERLTSPSGGNYTLLAVQEAGDEH